MSQYELQGDFRTEILEASQTIPIVVDFWAEWCGPCRILGPVLEKLASEAKGAWRLVKVNTEVYQDIAMALRIQSIPAVKMIYQGRIVGEFVGALPEPQIRQWLQQYLPEGTGNGDDGPEAGSLEEIEALIDAGQWEPAQAALERTVASKPEDLDARALLARLVFADEPERAKELVEPIPEDHPQHEIAEAFDWFEHLIALNQDSSSVKGGKQEVRKRYLEGASALAEYDYEAALEAFIEVLQRDRSLDDDGARKACIAVFKLLGEKHPLTHEYRRRFSAALY
jgi:putative thioredoxin